jgi:hypothetical protein
MYWRRLDQCFRIRVPSVRDEGFLENTQLPFVCFMLASLIGSLVSVSSCWHCCCRSKYLSNGCAVSTSIPNLSITVCITMGRCLLNLNSRWSQICRTECLFLSELLPIVVPLFRSAQMNSLNISLISIIRRVRNGSASVVFSL